MRGKDRDACFAYGLSKTGKLHQNGNDTAYHGPLNSLPLRQLSLMLGHGTLPVQGLYWRMGGALGIDDHDTCHPGLLNLSHGAHQTFCGDAIHIRPLPQRLWHPPSQAHGDSSLRLVDASGNFGHDA